MGSPPYGFYFFVGNYAATFRRDGSNDKKRLFIELNNALVLSSHYCRFIDCTVFFYDYYKKNN